jgi:hypothetical protein
MSRQFRITANMKPVQLLAPTTTNGGATSRRVSCKGAHKAFVVVELLQAVGDATTITLNQATAVTGGSTAAGPSVPNWLNEDTAAGDTLTQLANANNVVVANNIKSKQIVFEVDPAALTNGDPYIFVTSSNSAQATNFMSATAYLLPSYQQATPPTAVL